MAYSPDGPAMLTFVTRPVTGDVEIEKTVFDKKTRENHKVKGKLKDPVIVFYPNRTSQIMSAKEADRRGYLEQPDIMNFESVTDAKTHAGRYKFAMRMKDKLEAWQQMEDQVISGCISKSGHPLSSDANYSKKTMHFDDFVVEPKGAE